MFRKHISEQVRIMQGVKERSAREDAREIWDAEFGTVEFK
jgi:hypothetical protein